MRDTRTNLSALVVAAQGGDRRALDELVSAHLPFVYTIVRRTLGDHPDTDDVVQEVMLRALRELRALRVPGSFRAWLAAIAVRQLGTHFERRRQAALRMTPLDAVIGTPDVAADIENLTALKVELSGQRGEVVRAGPWLDPDDRALLSLWWLEVGRKLTRQELAEALGVTVPHAGVRVQRMRAQLDLSRSVVAALEARPRCPGLDSATASWDGLPDPLWRKRIVRHVQSCSLCARAAEGRVPPERLLVGLALLPVPAALAAAIIAKVSTGTAAVSAAVTAAGAATTGASLKAGLLSQLTQALVAHPVAAAVVAGSLVAGATVTAASWPEPIAALPPQPTRQPVAEPPPPTRAETRPPPQPPAPPAASPESLAPGPVSLEAANDRGFFVTTTNTFGFLEQVNPQSDVQTRQRAVFEVTTGLAEGTCFSFQLPRGLYLRHSSWRLRVFPNDGTALFRGDATFCVRPGSVTGSVWLESFNYPGWFLRHRGHELWVDHSDGTPAFGADSAFLIRKPFA